MHRYGGRLDAGLAQNNRGPVRVLRLGGLAISHGDQTSDCTGGYQWSSTK